MAAKRAPDRSDASTIHPGDIVLLDSVHLVPTRGGSVTWPHLAVCLYHYLAGPNPKLVATGTRFQFICISSLSQKFPFDPATQVLLDPADQALGLKEISALCVDFSATVPVTIHEGLHVLEGVRRLFDDATGLPRKIPASPTYQALMALASAYWAQKAAEGT